MSTPREQVLSAMAEVIADQSRVARVEASLAEAKRRLDASSARLVEIWKAGLADEPLPPLSELAALRREARAAGKQGREAQGGTLRDRVLALVRARPREEFGPAKVASALGARSRDSVRNTLLVLAGKGWIAKLAPGRYRAAP